MVVAAMKRLSDGGEFRFNLQCSDWAILAKLAAWEHAMAVNHAKLNKTLRED